MPQLENLSDLKPDPNNPRTITPEALAALKVSMERFGDLSGITFNIRTGHLIGAHQRLRIFKEYGTDVPIEYRADGSAYIKHPKTAELFSVRIVDWPEIEEKAANISANNNYIAGTWTSGLGIILDELDLNLGDLSKDLRLDVLRDDIPSPPSTKGKTDPDKIPDVAEDPIIKLGDLITLGSYVYCPQCGKKHYI